MKKTLFLALFTAVSMSSTPAIAAKTILAGGCFWCMEADFEKLDGVLDVVSGFTGGALKNPTYTGNHAGHYEAVEITYDAQKVSYESLLNYYWRHIDPFDAKGQFCDKGQSYLSAIFVANAEEKAIATKSKQQVEAIFPSQQVVTPILDAKVFYPIKGKESYHQDYYKNNPLRYKAYRWNCGRDQRLKEIWGDKSTMDKRSPKKDKTTSFVKPDQATLKKMLTPLQYKVTQNAGTERPFDNAYWDNKKEGIYVDIVSGEALFSSVDKYKSGTGWPSFTKPLVPESIVEKEDKSLFGTRIEVLSKQAGSHLGHVFDDGPAPTGLRYCINSAALRFIPKEHLEKEGYGAYMGLFQE